MKTKGIITCPLCGYKEEKIIPDTECMYFYECKKCKKRIKSLPGDCCVFCSYGDTKCIPMQKEEK